MASGNPSYHLVHIVTDGEYKTPLVASQLFDRAQVQVSTPGENKPLSVSVWIIEPMRDVWDKQCQAHIKKLQDRCPDVSIKLIGAIGRLKNWPALQRMRLLRRIKGDVPVVYHCRGEMSLQWAQQLKKGYKQDALVLDIRGFWPLERLAAKDIYDTTTLNDADAAMYLTDIDALKNTVASSNAVTTVSEPLKDYLVKHAGAPANSYVIPCCVMGTTADTQREAIRQELDITGRKALLYLGGTQKYQHLEDLVFPFLRSALKQSADYVAVFITQNAGRIQELIDAFGLPVSQTRVKSVQQNEVAAYLTAMDAGLLLRAPSVLNTFAQPVKLGEYLGAGLPVIVEEGTGNVAEMLAPGNIGYAVKLTGTAPGAFDEEVQKALRWLEQDFVQKRVKAREFVESRYTWAANASYEREMYINALLDTFK